nr:unnamed protein product [Callosobruchus analis]
MDDDGENSTSSETAPLKRCRILRRQSDLSSKKMCAKEEKNASIKKVTSILQKRENERSFEEMQILLEYQDTVDEIHERWKRREAAKKRLEEVEDPKDVLNEKCQTLAQAIAQSQHLIFYTGAGISTAAKIPDYRGPNGIWTRLQQGKDIDNYDLSLAEPTYTHMALSELYHKKILKFVVSQNCDGLHLRAGLPRAALSELHGNMNIEVCKNCKPHRQYWRLFDVTENTARYSHRTSRRCYACNSPLEDTIVHFGERGRLTWPLNWSGAVHHAGLASTIICLGSSLKVLKKYPWLWQMDKPPKKRPNLYIVNLQWTPKDDVANIKLNGRCDVVMKKVMDLLGISVPPYQKHLDPIYSHATELNELELHTTTQPSLKAETEDGSEKLDINSEYRVQTSMKDCVDDTTLDINHDLFNCDSSVKSNSGLPGQDIYNEIDFLDSDLPLIFSGYSDLFLYPYQTSFCIRDCTASSILCKCSQKRKWFYL